MFKTNVVEKIKTLNLCWVNFFFPPEIRAVYEIMWQKHRRARQATDDNMALARCMLDT